MRVLTGIQSSGRQHLGNILGAILPAIKLSQAPENDSFIFIADYHSLTTLKDGKLRKENTLAAAAYWLAFGLDIEKNTFYRQSDIPEVCELAWILNCFTPFPMLANAHSFKDKSDKLSDVNAGLFTYPVLMAADILMYDAQIVPVGKDQIQHLEITRDIASTFNRIYGETFVMPEVRVDQQVMTIPGTDGQKMSKSYNNYIDIFLPEKELKKKVSSIITDSLGLEEPKDPETCNVFKLYKLVATPAETNDIAAKYRAGGFGYGHAKNVLFEKLFVSYENERKLFNDLMNNPKDIEDALRKGADKARQTGTAVLKRVKDKVGF